MIAPAVNVVPYLANGLLVGCHGLASHGQFKYSEHNLVSVKGFQFQVLCPKYTAMDATVLRVRAPSPAVLDAERMWLGTHVPLVGGHTRSFGRQLKLVIWRQTPHQMLDSASEELQAQVLLFWAPNMSCWAPNVSCWAPKCLGVGSPNSRCGVTGLELQHLQCWTPRLRP